MNRSSYLVRWNTRRRPTRASGPHTGSSEESACHDARSALCIRVPEWTLDAPEPNPRDDGGQRVCRCDTDCVDEREHARGRECDDECAERPARDTALSVTNANAHQEWRQSTDVLAAIVSALRECRMST